MKDIKGEIVKRYMFRGKMVLLVRMESQGSNIYTFRVTDKCNKKDYYSNEKYTNQDECEKASYKVVKAI